MLFIFAAYFLVIAIYGSSKVRRAAIFLTVIPVISFLIDFISVNYTGTSYKSLIYIALTFDAILATILLLNPRKFEIKQASLLVTAVIVHTIQLIDIISQSNYVYDNYERYILLITLLQIGVAHDEFRGSMAGAIESFRNIPTMLHRWNVDYWNNIKNYFSDKKGKV